MSVLDASAILALLDKEPGAVRVAQYASGGYVSAVNAAEVATKLVDRGLPKSFASAIIQSLGIDIVDFDEEQAWLVGQMRTETRELGLSLGDRACLALSRMKDESAITADRAWSDLSEQFEIVVIR